MNHLDHLLPFIQSNWIWCALFLGVLIYYIYFEWITFRYRHHMRTPQQVVQLINKEHAQVLDLRPKNFFDSAHIKDAVNLDCDTFLKEKPKVSLKKDHPVVLFSGYESDGRKVLPLLKEQGFEKIFILSGGAQEWKKLNYPFVSSTEEKKAQKEQRKTRKKASNEKA